MSVKKNIVANIVGSGWSALMSVVFVNVVMYPNSSILGNSKISNNVVCSNNSMVLNKNIKSNSIIVGQHPSVDTKEVQTDVFSQFFTKDKNNEK